jgi:hypothetical protein
MRFFFISSTLSTVNFVSFFKLALKLQEDRDERDSFFLLAISSIVYKQLNVFMEVPHGHQHLNLDGRHERPVTKKLMVWWLEVIGSVHCVSLGHDMVQHQRRSLRLG